MKIDKNSLNDIKYISLGLENCDYFDIPVKYIVDINFEYIKDDNVSQTNDVFQTKGGLIEISSQALDIISAFGKEDIENIPHIKDYSLRESIINWTDVCVISIIKANAETQHIYLPYDPLCDCIHENEIELTNCPSAEILENGNLLLLFGESSKTPKRIDNNYKDLILGWDNIFSSDDKIPDLIKCKISHISNFDSYGRCPRLSVTFKSKRKEFELIFEDYKDLSFDYYPKYNKYCNLTMSKMIDGKIYVGFDGYNVDFYCSAIKEYDFYCGEVSDGEDCDEQTYLDAINLKVDEKTMSLIADNHYAFENVTLDFNLIKKAIQLYKNDKITLNYLRCWLKFYSEILIYSRPFYSDQSKIIDKVATILDRIGIAISYDYSKKQLLQIIETNIVDNEAIGTDKIL